MNQPLDEPEDLAGFKEALLIQHKKRCAALKRSVDDDLADMITARRIEVEGIVYGLRRRREKHLEEALQANSRYVKRQKKNYDAELQGIFFEALEEAVRSRLETFRRSPRYGSVLTALAAEAQGQAQAQAQAQENVSFPWVALVEKGDALFLSPSSRGNIREVREELRDVWGGLVLVEAGGGGRIVDNTFRTRWRRLSSSFAFRPDLYGDR
jgi:vacuolar-type H+-ATPase subunit E/Vma4